MQVRWEYLTPPEFKKLVKEEQICILPLGILERHGEHLPYGTDGLSVHAIACRAAALEPCVVFPTYWFGQGHEASCFAGSVNFPPRLLYEMLEVLLDQIARNGFKKIVIFSGHGGNSHFLDYFAMTQLDREVDYTLYILRGAGKRQLALADMWETKYGHAGEEETSQIMAITPEGVVKLEQQVYEEPDAAGAWGTFGPVVVCEISPPCNRKPIPRDKGKGRTYDRGSRAGSGRPFARH